MVWVKADRLLPTGYDEFLRELKERIRSAQVRAALAVNRELVLLYWQIGREILSQQQQQGWGAKVINQLAKDLKKAFPPDEGVFTNQSSLHEGIRAGLPR